MGSINCVDAELRVKATSQFGERKPLHKTLLKQTSKATYMKVEDDTRKGYRLGWLDGGLWLFLTKLL